MTKEELKELASSIKQKIKKLQHEMISLEESAAPVAPENSIGRISRMDAINNKSVVEAAIRHRKKKLGKLQVALANVHKPGFGLCKNCGKAINPKRIVLMPESGRCIKCA
ncbi:MAG: DnaK suppressor protein [Saprospiraceae bacterium]|jgi:DnaK suppressor protein